MSITIPQRSIQIQKLVDAIAATPLGDIVTHAALSSAIKSKEKVPTWVFYPARLIANQQFGIILGSVKGVGYKRLTTAEMPVVGGHARRRVSAIAKTSSRSLGNAIRKTNDIDDETKKRAIAEMTSLDLVAFIASSRVVPTQETEPERRPSVAETAREMMRKWKP